MKPKALIFIAFLFLLSCEGSKNYFLSKEDLQFKDSLKTRMRVLEGEKKVKLKDIFLLTNNYFLDKTSLKDTMDNLKSILKEAIDLIDQYADENDGMVDQNNINTLNIRDRYNNISSLIKSNSIYELLHKGLANSNLTIVFDDIGATKYIPKAQLIFEKFYKNCQMGRFLYKYGIDISSNYFFQENKYLIVEYDVIDGKSFKSKQAVFDYQHKEGILLKLEFKKFVDNY